MNNDAPVSGSDPASSIVPVSSSLSWISHEILSYAPITQSVFVIAESWPSWLSCLLSAGVSVTRVYSPFGPFYKRFFSRDLRWQALSYLAQKWITSSSLFFISGSFNFVQTYVPLLRESKSYVLLEKAQPHRRMLRLYPQYVWRRIQHFLVGGVTNATTWFGASVPLPSHVGPFAYPRRFLSDIVSSTVYGSFTEVHDFTLAPPVSSVVHSPSGSLCVNGIYPVQEVPDPFVIAPSVFHTSGWVSRRLTHSEYLDLYDQPTYVKQALLPNVSPEFLNGLPNKLVFHALRLAGIVLSQTLPSVPAFVPSDDDDLSELPALIRVPREIKPQYEQSVKHDDAPPETFYWDHRVLKPFTHLPYNVQSVQYLTSIRKLALRRWLSNLRRCFRNYLRSTYGYPAKSCPELIKDIDAFADCYHYASNATWFEWPAGSRLFFWRWPKPFRREARDGVPMWFHDKRPKYRRPQQVPSDPARCVQIKEKLDKIQRHRYVTPGFVQSLLRYFAVPKGDSDIRMVYDATQSGLNDCIWAPSFSLPVIESVLRATDSDTWMGDLDVGDQFLNFLLHEDARPYCGMDVTPFYSENLVSKDKLWIRWNRCCMGLTSSPYQAIRAMIWAEMIIRGDKTALSNPFRWDYVKLNLPGSDDYSPTQPWVSKRRASDGLIACDVFIYVDDARSTSPSEEEAWLTLRALSSRLGYLGIQDASRKRRPPSKRPGAWAGSMVYISPTQIGLYLSHDKWAKVKSHINWIQHQVDNCESKNHLRIKDRNWGIPHKDLERIRGFLVYASRTYKSMTPYLKGIHLTLDSWRPNRDDEGWKYSPADLRDLQAAAVEYSELYQENKDAPSHVYPVPRLADDLHCLQYLFEGDNPVVNQTRSNLIFLAIYGFGDASGSGFGASFELDGKINVRHGLWGRDSNSLSSNYKELRNLVETIEAEAKRGSLTGAELFLMTDNSVAESCFYKGTSKSRKLFDLILRLRKVEFHYGLRLHVIHVAGTRMIAQGTDGVSRGNMLEGVMAGQKMISFVPLHLSAFDRSETLLPWVKSWLPEDIPHDFLSHNDWYDKGFGIDSGSLDFLGLWHPNFDDKLKVWSPPPTAAFYALTELLRSRHMDPRRIHVFICPRLFTHDWRKALFKSADLTFYVPPGSITQWDASMHEPLAQLPFWKWKAPCLECGKTKEGIRGLFCANFGTSSMAIRPCRSAWCGKCYKPHPADQFHVNKPEDASGFERVLKHDENRFAYARNGDHIVTTFICDHCIFFMLKGRDPIIGDDTDVLLQCCIRRMNLDALWSRETSTVSKNTSNCAAKIKVLSQVGLEPQFEPLGPFPNRDSLGMTTAIAMLKKSLDPGNYANYTQFETLRKYRSVSSNQYLASVTGALAAVSLGKANTKHFITKTPTQSLWFEKFSFGCLKRMGQVIKRDLAISIEVFHALVQQFKTDIREAMGSKKHELIQAAVYSVIAFCGSFRGNEVFLVDLDGLFKYYDKLQQEDKHHYVIVPLLGRFKGETGERYHLTPLAAVTKTGIQVRAWIKLLLSSMRQIGRFRGPAFADPLGNMIKSSTMQTIILDTLCKVQSNHPDIISSDVDVYEEYGISRSFRRGATTHARNQGVSSGDIDAANRWRNVENAQGRKINQPMRDHYAEVKQMTPTLLRFSQAL